MKDKLSDVHQKIASALIGITLYPMIARLVDELCITTPIVERHLWIQSPSGKYYHLPFYQALRVVRKYNWDLIITEPTTPMTRWQYFKKVFTG